MKYLAFDIEAANGYKPYSICSLGYVLADEQFNILEKNNIWINPRCKYNLNGTRKNVGLDLHLDKELLDSSPDFSQEYDRIKGLLTDKNVTVVGHAVESDVLMLNKTCKHYKLPSINFDFICSQLLFKMFKGEKDVRALGKIADEINLSFCAHASDEDAYASLMTLKYLVQTTGLSVQQLLEKFNIRVGQNRNFEMLRTVSLTGQISKHNITKQAMKEIASFIATNRLKPAKGKLMSGNQFCLSRQIETGGQDVWGNLIKTIYACGGQYSTKTGKCNYYIYDDSKEQSQSDIARKKYVEGLVEAGQFIQVLSVSQFYSQIKDNI